MDGCGLRCWWRTALWMSAILGVVRVAATSCVVDNLVTQDNFDVNKYMGKWYEIRYLPYEWEDVSWIYIDYAEEYTLKGDGSEVNYVGKGRPENADKCNTHPGTYSVDGSDPAKWTNRMMYYNSTAQVEVDYWILHTDYDNYAFVYGCDVQEADGTCAHAHAWVWSRTNNLTESQQTLMEGFITDSCLYSDELLHLIQGKFCDGEEVSGVERISAGLVHYLPLTLLAITILNV